MSPPPREASLGINTALEDYRPETDWLDGSSPQLPHYDNSSQIQAIVGEIKMQVTEKLLLGCVKLLDSQPCPRSKRTAELEEILKSKPELWITILSAQKYGVLYWMSRSEARQFFLPVVEEHPLAAMLVDEFLQQNANACRIFNYAIHSWVVSSDHRNSSVLKEVRDFPKFIPPNAFSCLGNGIIGVRKQDFHDKSGEEIFNTPFPLYDLHDFAHLAAATLSPELYGSKYFSDLIKLDSSLTRLVTSPGIRTAKGPKLSDGMVFSEILTDLFTHEAAHDTIHTYASIQDSLARSVASYLSGTASMHHPSTGTQIHVDKPISPIQLAVLAQNKAYELTASEMEQRLFTRGGPDGDTRDVLDEMTAVQRIEYLAENKTWLYFEIRNTVKHRAQQQAYELLASRFIANGESIDLAVKILDNLTYEDWRMGQRLNLWAVVDGLVLDEGGETSKLNDCTI